jgi:S1-C subfamily serine protease
MFNPRSRAKAARETTARTALPFARRATQARPLSRAELRAGIRRIDALHYRVKRALITKAAAQGRPLTSALRLKRVRDARSTIGMRVGDVPRGSLWAYLGVQSGDVLRTLNGHPVADATAMLAAYSALERSPRLTLTLERGGRLINIAYRVD